MYVLSAKEHKQNIMLSMIRKPHRYHVNRLHQPLINAEHSFCPFSIALFTSTGNPCAEPVAGQLLSSEYCPCIFQTGFTSGFCLVAVENPGVLRVLHPANDDKITSLSEPTHLQVFDGSTS